MPTVEEFVGGTSPILATQIEFIVGMAENVAKAAHGTEMKPRTPT
jgi:hypothetical protein